MRSIFGLPLAAFLLGAGGGIAAAQSLPGGATSLNETHGDWTVACMTADGAARCAMMQNQVNGESRQRVVSVQLAAVESGSAAQGVLMLPFGLRLDAGVGLSIDENETLLERRFSTCLPTGCVVPLTLDAATVASLKTGAALRVTAIANESGQDIVFSIPLSGFGSALDRTTELNGS